jgi:death-on-curing protein
VRGDPDFLTVEDVVDLHAQQLVRYGGADGLRDQGLLESAVATPRASFGGQFAHEDVHSMAAAYAFHIAQNQPFVDGDKRTGLLAALVFLDINGWIVTDPDERLQEAMLAIADRRLDKGGLAALLRELSQPTAG